MSTKPWPADKVERRSVKSLLAYPRNARVHSKEQVAQIAASMKEFGWTIPILVDEQGVVIAGHGRLMAANKLKLKDVPVMVAAGWTEQQKAAYRLADNQLTLNSDWDPELLKIELMDLKMADYPLELTGFNDVSLVSFLSGVNDPNAEWNGMPEFGPPPKDWHRSMTVYFKTAEDVDKFVKKLGVKVTESTKTLFFPKPDKRIVKEYVSER